MTPPTRPAPTLESLEKLLRRARRCDAGAVVVNAQIRAVMSAIDAYAAARAEEARAQLIRATLAPDVAEIAGRDLFTSVASPNLWQKHCREAEHDRHALLNRLLALTAERDAAREAGYDNGRANGIREAAAVAIRLDTEWQQADKTGYALVAEIIEAHIMALLSPSQPERSLDG